MRVCDKTRDGNCTFIYVYTAVCEFWKDVNKLVLPGQCES